MRKTLRFKGQSRQIALVYGGGKSTLISIRPSFVSKSSLWHSVMEQRLVRGPPGLLENRVRFGLEFGLEFGLGLGP